MSQYLQKQTYCSIECQEVALSETFCQTVCISAHNVCWLWTLHLWVFIDVSGFYCDFVGLAVRCNWVQLWLLLVDDEMHLGSVVTSLGWQWDELGFSCDFFGLAMRCIWVRLWLLWVDSEMNQGSVVTAWGWRWGILLLPFSWWWNKWRHDHLSKCTACLRLPHLHRHPQPKWWPTLWILIIVSHFFTT